MATEPLYFRLDDLRRFATALTAGVGVAPARASALATHLLWFDAVRAATFGIETLPAWLESIEAKQVAPVAEGRVLSECAGTAVFDGQNGVPPLILARAGELAIQKARDTGVGLVRVLHLAPSGPAAAVTAELAIGPFVGLAVGPGGEWSVSLPCAQGPPVVHDSALEAPGPEGLVRSAPAILPHLLSPWAGVLVPEGGWLIAAIAVAALEPLATFHERVTDSLIHRTGEQGPLRPEAWEASRRHAREHGVPVAAPAWKALGDWAEHLNVEAPDAVSPPQLPRSARKKRGGAGRQEIERAD